MADTIDTNGLQVKTLPTLISELETALRDIYGADINLDSNSPDGQLVNIMAQAGVDVRELIQSTYNSFNPDRAVGRVLDERVAINNIQRQSGTYTNQPVSITTDRTVTLSGLDADFNNPDGLGFTVQDDAGNQFVLIDTVTLNAGTTSVNFRARNIGAVQTTVNTITNAVTIVLGVTGVNNPSGALETGTDEETDAELRIRRASSVANASSGYLNGLLGNVLNIDGVTEARLFENVTNAVDANGIPAHGIWLIAEGGSNTDIGNAIYERKSAGANMRGDTEVDITTASGATFTAKFDRPTAEDLYIRFDLQPQVTGAVVDQDVLKQYIVENLSYNIGQFAETSRITCIARDGLMANNFDFAVVNVEISSDDVTYVDFLNTSTLDSQFTVDVSRIDITEL